MFEAIRRVSLLGALLPSHTEVFAAVGLAVVSVAFAGLYSFLDQTTSKTQPRRSRVCRQRALLEQICPRRRTRRMVSQCSICLESIAEEATTRILLCRHEFHAECMDKWLAEANRCPLCSATIVPELPGPAIIPVLDTKFVQ
mmetsp:Transcript_28066/g.68201  ORF Transcript_28066/g.68201 Transcript_28066/m.68201 type:complete len:142 (+) Transcript_28066:122-547(+)